MARKDLATLLELEALDRDLFRGEPDGAETGRYALYGGQVAAQSLRAAGETVPPDRVPHSLHGYFLRRGRVDRSIIFRVDRDRDGGSFSARHVSAIQDGEVIFSMLASFHAPEESGTYDAVATRGAPDPESITGRPSPVLVEVREVVPTRVADGQFSCDTGLSKTCCARPGFRSRTPPIPRTAGPESSFASATT